MAPPAPPVSAAAAELPPAAPEHGRYLVRAGDTLTSLGVHLELRSFRELYAANGDQINNPNRIFAGQRLVVPRT